MTRVFISYRRDDSAATAGRLRDRLRDALGAERVFFDAGSIEAGADFVASIGAAIRRSDAMIVVIGAGWADPETGGRRLREPGDFVRTEARLALERPIRVLPVLVDGAAMPPAAALPEDLAPLARLNAFELRNARFDDDAAKLIEILTGRPPRRGPGWPRLLLRGALGAAGGLALYLAAAAAHHAATGAGLDAMLGRGVTLLLFPVFALAGAAAALRLGR